MADTKRIAPLPAFNFRVEIVRGDGSSPLAGSAFSECDGIEMSQEVKSLREGGNPNRVHRLSGPVSFGQLSLKRGVTQGADLWKWFSDSSTEWGRFLLSRCLPVKLKAPTLNARDGAVAIEELQIAYETFSCEVADA
jgi:hypothetical protein